MPVKDTSMEAYYATVGSNFLNVTLSRIYETLFRHPNSTPNECCELIEANIGEKINKPSYTPRFAVLERAGLIKSTGVRMCHISGRRCHMYEITNSVPEARVNERNSRQLKIKNAQMMVEIKSDIIRLTDEVTYLREALAKADAERCQLKNKLALMESREELMRGYTTLE